MFPKGKGLKITIIIILGLMLMIMHIIIPPLFSVSNDGRRPYATRYAQHSPKRHHGGRVHVPGIHSCLLQDQHPGANPVLQLCALPPLPQRATPDHPGPPAGVQDNLCWGVAGEFQR